MRNIDTLLHARWVLPIVPNIVLDHHSVAIDQGRIVDILPTHEAKNHYQAKETRDLSDHAVMPGLINMHTHSPMTLFRGFADDLELMDWLNHHIWPAEQKIINAQSTADGTRLAIAEMLRGGTTCFNENYFFTDAIVETTIEEGLRAQVGCMIMSIPTDWAKTEDEYFTKALYTLENTPKHSRIRLGLTPQGPYTVSNKSFERIKELAEDKDLLIHLHLHETTAELNIDLANHGKRPIQRLHDLKLLSPRLMAVHMVHVSAEEMSIIHETGTHVITCPESNAKLASGISPVPAFLKAGINVSIGTDGAASNNDLDMFGELRMASYMAKVSSGDSTVLPAAQALEMATINGAKALGLADEIGSLEKGKAADIIAIDLSHFFTQPVFNPISHLAYAVNRLQVSDVWVDGKLLLKSGEFTQLDIEKTVAKAREWAKAVRS